MEITGARGKEGETKGEGNTKGRGRERKMQEKTRSMLYSDIYWRGKGTVYNRILSRLSRSPIFHQLSYSFFSTAFSASPRHPFSPLGYPILSYRPHCRVALLIKPSVCSRGDNDVNAARKAHLSISLKNSLLSVLYSANAIPWFPRHEHSDLPAREEKLQTTSTRFHFHRPHHQHRYSVEIVRRYTIQNATIAILRFESKKIFHFATVRSPRVAGFPRSLASRVITRRFVSAYSRDITRSYDGEGKIDLSVASNVRYPVSLFRTMARA